VITKSGTNSFHGDAYYFGRWDALAARDFFNHQPNPITGVGVAPKNPYERNLYGASLGGPIIKDKTFFFVNYQGDRFITTLTDEATVPTPALISGNFTYTNPINGASVQTRPWSILTTSPSSGELVLRILEFAPLTGLMAPEDWL
jgi:hypothetical protein